MVYVDGVCTIWKKICIFVISSFDFNERNFEAKGRIVYKSTNKTNSVAVWAATEAEAILRFSFRSRHYTTTVSTKHDNNTIWVYKPRNIV